MNKDVFLAGIIGVVLGLLILPLSLQPFGLIAVPAVVAVVGSLAAKALLDRWQMEKQNTRNLLESINSKLHVAISQTQQQSCETKDSIKTLETQVGGIQNTVAHSNKVISEQINGFNEQYKQKIEAEHQISTKILENTAKNLQDINEVAKQFSESVIESQKKLVFLQEIFKRDLTKVLDDKLDALQDKVDDAFNDLKDIQRHLDRNTNNMAEDINTLVERSLKYQKEIGLAVSNQQAIQEAHREEIRNVINQISALNNRDIELMEKIISHG